MLHKQYKAEKQLFCSAYSLCFLFIHLFFWNEIKIKLKYKKYNLLST